MKLDGDRSGVLTEDEFAAVLENFNICLAPSEMKKLIHKFDLDHSGGVDYQEFLTAFGQEWKGSTAGGAAFNIQQHHGDVVQVQGDTEGRQAGISTQAPRPQRQAFVSAEAAERMLVDKLRQKWGSVNRAFSSFDDNRDG